MGQSGGEGPARERCNGENPAHAAVKSKSCPSSSLVAARTEATQKTTTGMPARHPTTWRLGCAYQPYRPRRRSALSRAGWPTPGKPSRKTDALVLSASARVSRAGEPMARIARSGQVRDLHHAGALDRPTSARDRDDFGIAGSQDRGQGKDGDASCKQMGDGPLCRGALFARWQ